MIWIKRGIFVLVGMLIIAFIGFNVFKKQIATAAFNRAIDRNLGVDRTADLPDGLHVYVCGSGSPLPDTSRAGPCLGVLAGKSAFVFDVGSGGTRNLGSMGFPWPRLDTVYLTHLHSDHIDGLGELLLQSWVAGGRKSPTPIVGPVGTAQVVDGFNTVYRIDSSYRVAHHGNEVVDQKGYGGEAFEVELSAGPNGKSVVFEKGELKITALRVEHSPVERAFGYRVDYKDRSVSISGDTIFHPAFNSASKDVDVMFHEALNKDMVTAMSKTLGKRGVDRGAKIFSDILDYHASPEEAARAAQNADADHLVLYHLVPPLPAKLVEAAFIGDARAQFDGPITIGRDGMIVSLPAGSEEVETLRRF